MFKLIKLEDHRYQLLSNCFSECFAQADAMPAKERSVGVRMPWLAVGSLVVLRLRVEALWNEGVVIFAPLLFIVVQQAHHDVDFIASPDPELLFGALGKYDILSDLMCRGEADGWLNPHGFFEAHHGVVEAVLDLLVMASFEQLLLIDLLTMGVPGVKGHQVVDFSQKSVLDIAVSVHMNVFE